MNSNTNNLRKATAKDLFGEDIPKPSKYSNSSDSTFEQKNQENYGERKRIKP